MHQPAVTDTTILRGYRHDLLVSKFLSDFSLTLRSREQGQILRGDSIFTLTATFSRVMRISTESDASSTPSIEQSTMIFDRGRGRDCDFGG